MCVSVVCARVGRVCLSDVLSGTQWVCACRLCVCVLGVYAYLTCGAGMCITVRFGCI